MLLILLILCSKIGKEENRSGLYLALAISYNLFQNEGTERGWAYNIYITEGLSQEKGESPPVVDGRNK